jgi:hypothetical protein
MSQKTCASRTKRRRKVKDFFERGRKLTNFADENKKTIKKSKNYEDNEEFGNTGAHEHHRHSDPDIMYRLLSRCGHTLRDKEPTDG